MPKKNKCDLSYARGLYQGEGTFYCEVLKKPRRARLNINVRMFDKEALIPLEPCFEAKVTRIGREYRIEKHGKKALELAEKLAVTPTRKKQVETALKRCRKYWAKGYTDQAT